MEQVTKKDLQAIVDRLNDLTGNPKDYFNKDTNKINIGHYCLSGAYGGWQLQQTMNAGGGVNLPLYSSHIPKRELYEHLYCFLCGINLGKGVK